MKTKKLSANAKKVIVLCSMVALLIVTGTLNFVLNDKLTQPGSDGTVVSTSETFFTSCRAERETARAEEFSLLDAILTSDTSTEELIASANEKKLELIDTIERELVLEGLVKAQGFEDAVVTMSEDNINIVVSQSELTSEQVSAILSVILEETEYSATQVVVVPYSEE